MQIRGESPFCPFADTQLATEITGEGRTCSWRRRCIAMESYAAVLLDPGALRLIALAERCAHEPASRQLDGEIYNAVRNIEDFNLFPDDNLWEAKRNGQETVERPGWRVVAPRWKAGGQPNRRGGVWESPLRGFEIGSVATSKTLLAVIVARLGLAARGGLQGNLHYEVPISGICPGSHHIRPRLHFLLQHDEDGAGSCSRPTASRAANGLL